MTDGKTFPAEVLQQIVDEDGWRPIVCRGNDESHSGIRTAQGRRWALRTHRVVLHVRDSSHAAGFAHGTAGSTWSPPKPSPNMPRSLGVNFRMRCSRRSRNWTQPPCSGSWAGWSRRRLCTNEVCHHRRPTPLSMRSFRMLPMQSLLKSTRQQYHQRIAQVLEAQFPRPLRHSQNCWRITTRRQGSLHRRWATGSGRASEPATAQPIWKPSATSPRD